jgi:hypothetical protein
LVAAATALLAQSSNDDDTGCNYVVDLADKFKISPDQLRSLLLENCGFDILKRRRVENRRAETEQDGEAREDDDEEDEDEKDAKFSHTGNTSKAA